jgi:serine/threonine-protein kinase
MTAGDSISHYRILAEIGKGGMGVVYKAEDTRLHRTVALKFLTPDQQAALGEDVEQKQRFLREARIAARLSHPNICPIHEVDEVDGTLFFAMAYIEGQTLSQLIKSTIQLPESQILDLAIQIANGLEEARRQNVIHRDIKSSNIIVTPQGHVYILDFGLALAEGTSRLTVSGQVYGTPGYMSPEQARGQEIDHRSDVWALGVVLYEMLTGRRPFGSASHLQTLYAIVNEDPAPIEQLRPDLPAAYSQIVDKALAKNPELRWQTAGELAEALRQVRETGRLASRPSPTYNEGEEATTTLRVGNNGGTSRRRTWLAWGGAAALVVSLLGGLVYWRSTAASRTTREKHVAVLPFDVIGNDANLRATTDGLVETLTSRLTGMEELPWKIQVVPASEIRARKITSAEDARRIYGANLVIAGSAQTADNSSVQLIMNLIDTETMRQTGSRTLQLNLGNPIAIRDAAFGSLIRLLEVQLTPGKNMPLDGTASGPGETANPDAYGDYLRGRGYLTRFDVAGNIEGAIQSMESALRRDPNYTLARVSLAEAFWRKALQSSDKQWAGRAIAEAEKAVQMTPDLAAARSRLGDIYSQNGRPDDAIRELQAAQRLDPGHVEAHRALAMLYENMGRVSEAETAYVEVTQRRPSDWLAFVYLGVFYWNQNRYDQAEAAFERAKTLTPDNEIVYRNLAGMRLRQGRYADAQKEVQRALQLTPSARGYSLLGLAYYYSRRYVEAAKALESSVSIDPAYYVGWGNLGSAYRQIPGSKEKADAAFRKAIELGQKRLEVTPTNYSVRANLTEYWAKLGNTSEALAEMARIPPQRQGEFWGRLALAYELCGKRAEAVRFVQQALASEAMPQEVKDDPELTGLLADPALRGVIKNR